MKFWHLNVVTQYNVAFKFVLLSLNLFLVQKEISLHDELLLAFVSVSVSCDISIQVLCWRVLSEFHMK